MITVMEAGMAEKLSDYVYLSATAGVCGIEAASTLLADTTGAEAVRVPLAQMNPSRPLMKAPGLDRTVATAAAESIGAMRSGLA